MRKILYLQYVNPAAFPPLEHSSEILAKEGWQVMFLGIKQPETTRLTFPHRKGITVKQIGPCPPGWRQKFHYAWFALRAITITLFWRPGWVYASDPLSSPAAYLVSLVPGVRVIYHEHDSPSSESSDSSFMRVIFKMRRALGARAKLCILPNEQRALVFSNSISNGHTFCVWNCPSLTEVPEVTARTPGSLWLLYHGTIVPSRLPLSILEALKLLPDNVRLRVVGYETSGHRGYVQQLREKALQLGLSERIDFVGSVPTRRELFDWCLRSHVGLAFMPSDTEDINGLHMTGASNKAFDYMACGVALLVSNLPDWRQLFVEGGYGLSCDIASPQSIADAVRWYVDHPDETQQMGQRGWQKVMSDWHYEKQFAPILQQLNAS